MTILSRELFRNILMSVQQPLESYLLRRANWGQIGAPCFIIGAPRSGTTLLYESLLTKYRFSYLSNLADRFYSVPASSTYLGRQLISSRKLGSFSSRYGQLSGWGAPSEGGRVWNRWFPQSHYLSGDDASCLPVDTIRNTIMSIAQSLKSPFLNKNVMHSVHVELLDVLFPGCIFIEIQRDVVANVRSILRARQKKGGPVDLGSWWSVKPSNWQEYQEVSAEEQACVQVCSLRKDIADQVGKISSQRLHIVQYEDFCRRPDKSLRQIKSFIERHCDIELQGKSEIPEEFVVSSSIPFSTEVEDNISKFITAHYPSI